MAEYKQIDLQIGTEAQFESKKETLPVGTIVGITDPIHKSELDSDLQTTISDVANKLNKPSGTPTADSVVKVSSTGTVAWKPVSDFVDTTSAQTISGDKDFSDNVRIQKKLWASGSSILQGGIKGLLTSMTINVPTSQSGHTAMALAPNTAPTEPSFIVTAADRTPTWQSAAPILQDYVDDALLGG